MYLQAKAGHKVDKAAKWDIVRVSPTSSNVVGRIRFGLNYLSLNSNLDQTNRVQTEFWVCVYKKINLEPSSN